MRAAVALYVPSLEVGGTEQRVARLAAGVDRRRFQVIVLCAARGPLADRIQAAGVPVVGLPVRDQPQAESVLRRLSPAIFHSFSYSRNALDVMAARAAEIPFIITSRVNMREWDELGCVQDWELERNRATHRITAVSQAVAARCESVEGISHQNIVVIHNGVPIDKGSHGPAIRQELGIADDIQLAGFIANYRPEKAHDFLFECFRRVVNQRPNTHLLCCGHARPGVRERLQELVHTAGLPRHVTLLGFRPDVPAIYRGLDVYLQSSRLEGLSNALLEAMSQGVPVVATAVGGTPEAVQDGVTGLLVNPDDPQAFADAVIALLDDPSKREQFSSLARARVKRHFSIDAMISSYCSLWEDTLVERLARPAGLDFRDKPIRILFHVDYLWSGGLEKKVRNIVLGLDRRRFEPIVSWNRKWGVLGEELKRAGVRVERIVPGHGAERRTAVAQIREIQPDIFHSFSCRLSGADTINAHDAGVPWIVTSRGSLHHGGAGDAWQKERNRATHRIIACSRAVAAQRASDEGLPPEQITVIHNGVRLPADRPQARMSTQVWGYAATYRPLKGHDILLRAFRLLADQFPELRLLCCGEQYDDTKLRMESLARDIGLSDRVAFLDVQYDMSDMYRQMGIYVHPSLSEGFSNSILEAMAHGLPVVAADVGGNPEAVVTGVTGLLVPPGDADALARAMTTLLLDPALCRKMGHAGYARVRHSFSLRSMIAAYEAFYSDTVAPTLATPQGLHAQ